MKHNNENEKDFVRQILGIQCKEGGEDSRSGDGEETQRPDSLTEEQRTTLFNYYHAVLDAVREDWRALWRVTKDMKDNPHIARAALTSSFDAWPYISERLRGDKEFVLSVVPLNKDALLHAKSYKDDNEVVAAAVDAHPNAIQYASERIRRERQPQIPS